jgi:GH24 family phage-related lysozyme (muramidase)
MPDPALGIAVPLIAGFEGFRSAPYRDIGGTWTTGYGFTYLADGSAVTQHTPHMTQAEACATLTTIVARTMAIVADMINKPISNNAMAACTSFAYNEGPDRFRRSAILAHINAGDLLNAALYFGGYVYCNGKWNADLSKRRGAEAKLFVTPDGAASQPVISECVDPARLAVTPRSQMTADELDNLYNPGA